MAVLLILMYWPWIITTDLPYVIAAATVPAGSATLAFIINKAVCFVSSYREPPVQGHPSVCYVSS